jgi:hypothetical protein
MLGIQPCDTPSHGGVFYCRFARHSSTSALPCQVSRLLASGQQTEITDSVPSGKEKFQVQGIRVFAI